MTGISAPRAPDPGVLGLFAFSTATSENATDQLVHVHHSAALVFPDAAQARGRIRVILEGTRSSRHRSRRGTCVAHTNPTHRALSSVNAPPRTHALSTARRRIQCSRWIVACTRWLYTECKDRRATAFRDRRRSHSPTFGALRQREPEPRSTGVQPRRTSSGCGGAGVASGQEAILTHQSDAQIVNVPPQLSEICAR